jgi:hypothetical protein
MKITKNTIVYINYICLIWWQCMVVAVAAENGNDTSFLLKLSLEELLQVKITTIATGKQQLAIFAPANTTTISSEDMELMAALDVDEVLEGVPGLHVARNSMSFYSPIYALGGIASIYNPEALILLNGIPINTLYTGARILGGYGGGIPTSAIERIEVIRGPGSALYGADALSGVINIITKTANDFLGGRGYLGRWGGEEFAIVFTLFQAKNAYNVADHMRAMIAQMSGVCDTPITVSVGITELHPNDTIDAIVIRADRAVYQAKRNGKNRTEVIL